MNVNFLKKVREILGTTTIKKSSITFTGTVANAFFGAIFYILAARYLGPSAFGIMTVALTILTLSSDMGDLGTDTGLVNFVSRFINDQKEKAYKFLKLGLKIKVFVWLSILIVGVFLSGFISTDLFLKPELRYPLIISFIGVGSLLLFSFIIHTLQAMQRFWSWSAIQTGTNLLRLILFTGIAYFGFASVENTLWVYIIIPFLGFIIGLKLIGTDFLKINNERSVFRDFFKYNKWVAVFAAVAAISARMDTFISARLLDSSDVGIYSAANQMVKIVPQIVIALGTVLGPKMAETSSFAEFLSYLKKTQLMVVGLSILGIGAIPIVIWLIPYIFGVEYVSSGPVFVILLFAMLILLLSVPVHSAVLYYFQNSKLFFGMSVMHLIAVAIFGYILTSKYGMIGAATAVLIGQLVDLFVPGYFVISKIRTGKK